MSSSLSSLVHQRDELSKRLQDLLDKQWDGLSERQGRWITSARQGIEQTMTELLDIQNNLAEAYESQINRKNEWLERTKNIQDKIAALKIHVDHIEKQSDLSKEIEELEKEQVCLNDEIAELQFKLKKLYSRKQEITTRLMHLKSTVESKSSSYKHEIETLGEPPSTEQIEACSREVDAITDQFKTAELEASALRDGLILWKDVCMIVSDLENSLSEILSKEEGRGEKIHTVLSDASDRVQKHLDIATDNGWSLLTVAINHELQAIYEGMKIVDVGSSMTKSTTMSNDE